MDTTTKDTDNVGTLCERQPSAGFEERLNGVSVLRHVDGDRHEGIVREGGRAVHFAARLPGFDIEADGYLRTDGVACLDIRIPGIVGPDRDLIAARIRSHFQRRQEDARHAKDGP